MFALSLLRAQHVRHYSISAAGPLGWEVRCQEDETVQRLDHYEDWHRVERALRLFEREVSMLSENGWRVAPAPASSQ